MLLLQKLWVSSSVPALVLSFVKLLKVIVLAAVCSITAVLLVLAAVRTHQQRLKGQQGRGMVSSKVSTLVKLPHCTYITAKCDSIACCKHMQASFYGRQVAVMAFSFCCKQQVQTSLQLLPAHLQDTFACAATLM